MQLHFNYKFDACPFAVGYGSFEAGFEDLNWDMESQFCQFCLLILGCTTHGQNSAPFNCFVTTLVVFLQVVRKRFLIQFTPEII